MSSSSQNGPSPIQPSPIKPAHSFAHHTSSAAPLHPFIDTSTPAINAAPIELDSTPVSPVAKQYSWPISGGPRSADTSATTPQSANSMGKKNGVSPDHDQEVYSELSGEVGVGLKEREKRAALLKERSQDPAVVVDLPQEPAADELEVVEAEAIEVKEKQQPA
ncbi:hypothetical protein NA57DRAFT_75123 [Rhizodiscina lignyota]|uniref:Uncharacterized protein n=1 Tax=Rhizodiscina lignyota TaxID=1504668 RepID=A0A9P4IHA0_9PEZI|nr:hypothetical protein NA57DRAFT_75123 [Rhizodiscina lignyota]